MTLTVDGLPAIATACQRVTSELLDLSLARAHGHRAQPRSTGTRAHGHNPDPRAHGHMGTRAKPTREPTSIFCFGSFPLDKQKQKFNQNHTCLLSLNPIILSQASVCVSVLWSFLNSLAHCPKACQKNLGETRMTRTQNCRLSWNFGGAYHRNYTVGLLFFFFVQVLRNMFFPTGGCNHVYFNPLAILFNTVFHEVCILPWLERNPVFLQRSKMYDTI